jgi:hypothetical protein
MLPHILPVSRWRLFSFKYFAGAAATASSTRHGRAAVGTGRRLGIVLSDDRTEEDGATIFRQACVMGLEGIVSKRLTAPYPSGPSRDWLKVKNPNCPAMIRAREGEW